MMSEPSASLDALIKMGTLCMQSEKPTTYTELNSLLWQAFYLGQQYGSGKIQKAVADNDRRAVEWAERAMEADHA